MKIVVEELAGAALNLRREGCREHEGLPRLLGRHAGNADGASDVRHEALVQHPVRLVQDEELDVAKGDVASFSKVKESPRCCHKDVTAPPQLRCLQVQVKDGYSLFRDEVVPDAWSECRHREYQS